MESGDLKIFEAVARLGSMNRAARELNTVQSNITARVKLLEERLGVHLFERHNRGVTLTSAGRRLLPFARRVASLIVDAARAARDDGTPRGPLVIGSLETTAALRLAPLLATYVEAYPEVDLALRTGTSAELVERVLAHEVEGAFVCGPVDHPELVSEHVLREELVILTAATVPDLDSWVRAGDFKIVVLRAGCSYRLHLEALLARRGIVHVRQLEFGTLDAIMSCVSAGLGITLLPRALVDTLYQNARVALHALPAREAMVATVFIRRQDAYVSSALRAFHELARPAWSAQEAAE